MPLHIPRRICSVSWVRTAVYLNVGNKLEQIDGAGVAQPRVHGALFALSVAALGEGTSSGPGTYIF
jgi:hypothetical protein